MDKPPIYKRWNLSKNNTTIASSTTSTSILPPSSSSSSPSLAYSQKDVKKEFTSYNQLLSFIVTKHMHNLHTQGQYDISVLLQNMCKLQVCIIMKCRRFVVCCCCCCCCVVLFFCKLYCRRFFYLLLCR